MRRSTVLSLPLQLVFPDKTEVSVSKHRSEKMQLSITPNSICATFSPMFVER
jgi:hypothetical protein